MPSFAINDSAGCGLLRLPPDWHSKREAYVKVCGEITDLGYVIVGHDKFNVRLDECTFYVLQKGGQ